MIILLVCAVIFNLFVSASIAWGGLPFDLFTLRFAGGFFLLVFVCLHGWYRYGWQTMLIFFGITLAITWSAESLSIETGIPFGNFHYTDLLGDKIGHVPILIIPAYFFNGYLAWTLGNLFAGNLTAGMHRKDVVRVPLISTVIMVMWNLSFDPIMSTIEGNWVWHDGGFYFGVPLSNFIGWFITVFLVFQLFSFFLLWSGHFDVPSLRMSHWYLFPFMYMVQGLPSILYSFFRENDANIYQPIALITFLTMFLPAIASIFVIRYRIAAKA